MTEINHSPEWWARRCGSLGASSIHDATSKLKSGGYSAARQQLMSRLICERLTGTNLETYRSQAMLEGTEREPVARAAYELVEGVIVEDVGVIAHPSIPNAHACPDGRVWPGLIEIKCPQPAAHLDALLHRPIPLNYLGQMHWQMACSGAAWCDFVSYNQTFPGDLMISIRRIERDQNVIDDLEAEAIKFLAELEATMTKLSQHGRSPADLVATLRASIDQDIDAMKFKLRAEL